MKIGIDIKAFKNGTTGIARYLKSMLDMLQSIDAVNEYVLFEPTRVEYSPTNPRWSKILITWKLPGTLWQQFILPFHLKKHKVDVLWAPEQVCPLCVPAQTGVVTTVHDLAYLHFPGSLTLSNLLVQKWSARWVLRKSNVVVTVSEFVRWELLNCYGRQCSPEKVIAIPNGAPDWKIPASYSRFERKDFLFFAGNLEPRKNLPRLIKALEILHVQGVDIPLHLAGPAGWRNRALFRNIEQSTVSSNVHLLGYLSEEDLRNQYLTCRALVYPSLYEGFGLPVLEALAMDCPIVTSKGTVMEEIAGNNAEYADPLNEVSLAQAIGRVIRKSRNGSLRSDKKIVRKYSWHKAAQRILHAFESCFSMHGIETR